MSISIMKEAISKPKYLKHKIKRGMIENFVIQSKDPDSVGVPISPTSGQTI